MSSYKELGVTRVINGQFPVTRLGGSVLPKEVQEAMAESTCNWCNMWELEENSGAAIARVCGAEAALVTPGAFAALVLSAAACIAGRDPEKMRRLPDTSGMRNEIIIQRNLRAIHAAVPGMYDRSMEVPGGKLVQIGHEVWGAQPSDLESAIGEKTAAIFFLAPDDPDSKRDIIPLSQVIKIGHARDIPIIVDAAGQTYPIDLLSRFARMGADLVCYAAKYVQGANSAGWVCGRKDLVEAAALHSFLGQESGGRDPKPGLYKSIGRGYKMDRQEIVGTVFALERWVKMDHQKERVEPALRRISNIKDALRSVPHLQFATWPDHLVGGIGYHQLGLQITFENKTPTQVLDLSRRLQDGDPSIWVYSRGNSLQINALYLGEGDEHIIARRLKSLISS
jgi:seryl-tRNA(Sec) selenium transferase